MKILSAVFVLFFLYFFQDVFAKEVVAKNSSNISSKQLAVSINGVIVAKVNNHIITYRDVEERYRFLTSFAKIKINSKQEKSVLVAQIIDKMIDEELIRQEAEKLKMSLTDEEIDDAVESVAIKRKETLASFKKSFAEKNLSFDSYREQIKADILWSKIVSESLKSHIKINDAKIKEFLEQHKFDVDVTKFLIAEIFIQSDSKDAKFLANKLTEELRLGADFLTLVQQFSHSPNAESSGEIGWVSKADVDAKIYEAVSALSKNGYSDPVFLTQGYHIFKLLDKKSFVEIKENDMNAARNRIFMRDLDVEAKKYLMDLRKEAFIEVTRAAVERIY